MAAVILRRKASVAGPQSKNEILPDKRPLYLKVFPSPANISKDLALGVLLGR
jgi:hypothetical protein